MRVLVTGATGRIGTHLVRELLGEGHRVCALVMPGDLSPIPNSVDVVTGKLSDTDSLATAADRVEAVFHLAGALTSRGHSETEFVESNLRGTCNLLCAVRDRAPCIRRFIYASSDAVYSQSSDRDADYLPVDEAHPILAGTVYGATKVGAEEMCRCFSRGFSIPVTILRFGATANARELIDPGSVFARWLFLRAAIEASRTGSDIVQSESMEILQALDGAGEQLVTLSDADGNPEIRQWADARDIARGCLHALGSERAAGETLNMGGPEPFSVLDLGEFMSKQLSLSLVTACLPKARRPWYISSEKAQRILGYKPQYSVFDMVKDTIKADR